MRRSVSIFNASAGCAWRRKIRWKSSARLRCSSAAASAAAPNATKLSSVWSMYPSPFRGSLRFGRFVFYRRRSPLEFSGFVQVLRGENSVPELLYQPLGRHRWPSRKPIDRRRRRMTRISGKNRLCVSGMTLAAAGGAENAAIQLSENKRGWLAILFQPLVQDRRNRPRFLFQRIKAPIFQPRLPLNAISRAPRV